jgi:hypothetical protein
MKTTKTKTTPERIICTYCTFTPEGMRELDRLDRLPLKDSKEVA